MPPLPRVLCALFGALILAWPLLTFGQGTPIYGNRVMTGHMNFCKPVGGSDVYACNLVSAITAYVEGAEYSFEADVANTGVATINFNSVGARTIKKYNDNITTDLADGDICAGQQVIVRYDGTNMQMISPLCNPPATGDALTSGHLGQFAATTSAQLATVLSDEAGTGGGFVRLDGAGVFTGKTFDLTDNTLVGTLAELNTAISDANLPPTSLTLTINGTTDEITCTGGAQDLSTNRTWTCAFASTTDFNGQLLLLTRGTATPGTCTVGQVFFDTDATAGHNLFGCTATDTWTVLGSDSFSDLTGTASDAQIPHLNTLSTGLTASRCVETDGSGVLTVAAGTCGTSSGFVTITGTPTSGQVAEWTSASAIQGVATTGSGSYVRATSPALVTPTGIVKGDVGLGNVDNTSNATERAATRTLTNATFDLTDNTLVGTLAELNTAISDANLVPEARTITIAGTANQITSSVGAQDLSTNRTWTLSIPTNPTLPGTTTGTFSGNLTGNVTGNADTATALAANGANCSAGQAPLGVNASGVAEGCFSVVRKHAFAVSAQTSVTVTGATHGLGTDDIQVQCWTNTNPRVKEEAGWTVNSSSFDVIVTWGVSFTGRCNIQG